VTTGARRLWTVTEPVHALTYFAPEARAAFAATGLRGFWRGYFAGRAAPLGRAPAQLVTATFFGFHPAFVARAVPSIWDVVNPAAAVDARLAGIDAAMHTLFGNDLPTLDLAPAVDGLRAAIEATPTAGRPLFGANVELPWPEAPHLALWHAATLLREHRGDGHVAVLTAAGLDGCSAHVLRIVADDLPLDSIQPYRGWDEVDWAAAADRLRAEGWLDGGGRITHAGAELRLMIETDTDRLSAALVDRMPDVDAVATAVAPLAERIGSTGVVPYPNPIGVPPPA
jgi:hypothetical protein